MINQEENKRKLSNNARKSSNSATSLLSGKDHKNLMIGNDHEHRKVGKDRKQRENMDESDTYGISTKPTKQATFKPPKQKVSKTHFQQQKQLLSRRSKDNFTDKNKLVPLQEPRALEITVNIQNMLETKAHSPKNNSMKAEKKMNANNGKVTNYSLVGQKSQDRKLNAARENEKKIMQVPRGKYREDELECREVLSFKKYHQKQGMKLSEKMEKKSSLIEKQKAKAPSSKELIKKFQGQMGQINANFDYEALTYLDIRQQEYQVPANYIEKCQKNMSWLMRAMLIEWVMNVCFAYSLKRETFHISVYLIDIYFSREYNLPRSDFQLVGASSMFIASKIEEFEPRSSEQFVKSVNNSYTGKQIKEMEKRICKIAKYQLNPPTMNRWSNRLMIQWDSYIQQNNYGKYHRVFGTCEKVLFKECDENAYMNYRHVYQLIDCTLHDIQTLQYQPKLLVCGFMYLVIGCKVQEFHPKQVASDFPYSSLYLLSDTSYNDLFSNFLETTFNLPLIDLLPTIQYCATYFILPLSFEKPNTDEEESMQLEQYCSFQTYNKHTFQIIRKRQRDQ